jgi:hypothetical protein
LDHESYVHSGKAPLTGLVLATLGSSFLVAVCVILAIGAEDFFRKAPLLPALFVLGSGVLAGVSISVFLKAAKARSRPAAILVGFLVAAVGVLALVGVKRGLVLGGLGNRDAALDATVALEALFLFIPIVGLAATYLDSIFCERCGVWCDARPGFARIPRAGGALVLRERFERRDWPALVGQIDPRIHYRIDLHRCPRCEETNAVNAYEDRIGPGLGRTSRSRTRWIDRLLLTKVEVEAFQAALDARLGERPAPIVAPGVQDVDALPEAIPLTPEEEARYDKVQSLGRFARQRATERKREEREAVKELVPNDEGRVYGPTRAELVVTGVRVAAAAPLFGCPASMLFGVVGGLYPQARNGKTYLSCYGTVLAVAFLLPQLQRLRPRPLTRVRARVFEREKRDVHFCLYVIGFYAVVVALALVN